MLNKSFNYCIFFANYSDLQNYTWDDWLFQVTNLISYTFFYLDCHSCLHFFYSSNQTSKMIINKFEIYFENNFFLMLLRFIIRSAQITNWLMMRLLKWFIIINLCPIRSKLWTLLMHKFCLGFILYWIISFRILYRFVINILGLR